MGQCVNVQAFSSRLTHGLTYLSQTARNQLLTRSGSLTSDLRAPSTSDLIARVMSERWRDLVSVHPFLSLDASASTPRVGRSPHGIATTRGVLATTRGMLTTTRGVLTRRGSTLPPTLPSLLAGGTCLLNSELLSSTALCSLHSRRPHSQPPPSSACLHLPASRWLARDGAARDGAARCFAGGLTAQYGARRSTWRLACAEPPLTRRRQPSGGRIGPISRDHRDCSR